MATLVERLRKTLEDVVGMQLMADVPIGAYLSGGVDSACVVAAAIATAHPTAHLHQRQRGF
jgi:asparagine synthase (glutamine-hydrolysing)